MAKKLRESLLEPSAIPKSELSDYMGDTYRGYMVAVRERLNVFEANRSRRFGYAELDKEFFALQLRMMFELVAFAVITFQQQNEPIAKSKRKINGALDAMKLVQNYNWLNPVDPSYKFNLGDSEYCFPNIKSLLSEESNFRKIHGRLGDLLHEQQRPRFDNEHRLELEELFRFEHQLRILIGQHNLTDQIGNTWYVNINFPGQPSDVLVLKATNI